MNGIGGILLLSLQIAGTATLLALVIGSLAAWYLTGRTAWWARGCELLIYFPLFLPPTLVGFYLLSACGPQGPVGGLLTRGLGLEILFSPQAAVLAAMLPATPLVYRSVRSLLESIKPDVLSAARLDGATEWQIFVSVRLPLAYRGVLAGLLLALLRALGEFGATIMVAGNIPQRTQTATLAIWDAVMSADWASAHALALALILICLAVVLLIERWGNRYAF